MSTSLRFGSTASTPQMATMASVAEWQLTARQSPTPDSQQLMRWTALLPPCGMIAGMSWRSTTMSNITTIGLDIAKSVFQVHAVDSAGEVVVRRKLTRGRVLAFFERLPRCLVGIEACSSSHYWARELISLGHDVRLLPAQYVTPYLKRQKNDAADAEAICEAVTRPTMRFVPV